MTWEKSLELPLCMPCPPGDKNTVQYIKGSKQQEWKESEMYQMFCVRSWKVATEFSKKLKQPNSGPWGELIYKKNLKLPKWA